MGASESTVSSSRSRRPVYQITTVSQKSESVDPVLEELKALKITTLIRTSPPTEGSLNDILGRKPSSSSTSGTVNPSVGAFLNVL
ncbi:uncharacterized protein LOC123208250 isoform X2 [Mangifera indica]|uniref:uncharacterized protein LOC123208250 isoform X2 n=1 Tax=Mangifera indica TaxID=29780 RepID=UPI001CFB557E|nr:uncharacterized protein LOC123208250 isoform X2 [Mangifera indica]